MCRREPGGELSVEGGDLLTKLREAKVEQALRVSRVGELVRTVFPGTETIGRVGPRKVVVMCERDDRLGPRVAELRRRLVGLDSEVPPARVWIESLPDSEAEAAALLDDLSRA